MTEIYVSVDIEADRLMPGDHSILTLGSVAYDSGGILLSTFTVNIAPLQWAKQYPDTMESWEENPEAWKAAQTGQQIPDLAMDNYAV